MSLIRSGKMDFKICDAKDRYVGEIEKLENLCFSVPWTAEQIRSQLSDDSHDFLVALDECDNVVGYIGLMSVLDEGYISNVAVSPTARGNGIAKALISKLMQRAERRELAFVTLEVRESNTAARKLYSSCGFTDVGVRKNYYAFPKEDAILMTLYLK